MSSMQKALRIICILSALWSALGCVVGLFILFGVPFVLGDTLVAGGVEVDAAIAQGVTGSIVLMSFVFNLFVALLGIRGAKDPSKIGVFKVIALVAAGLSFIGIALDVISGQLQNVGWSSVVSTLFMIVLASLGSEIQRAYISEKMRELNVHEE